MPHITFIHGISNKPPHDQLVDIWCRSLADATGLDLGGQGVTCSMVYWADVMYAEPLTEGAIEESAADESVVESRESGPEAEHGLGVDDMSTEEKLWTTAKPKRKPPTGIDLEFGCGRRPPRTGEHPATALQLRRWARRARDHA